jgi:hypothetical protein
MARGNIKVMTPTSQLISTKWLVAAGAAGASGGGGYRGEPFMSRLATAAQTGIVAVGATSSTLGTWGLIGGTKTISGRFVGVAKSDSTQTASVAGVVYTWLPTPFIVYEGKPLVAGSCNTDAKIDALRGSAVLFDLSAATSGVYTVSTAATDAAANALVIIGGNPQGDTVHFVIKDGFSVLGSVTTQT